MSDHSTSDLPTSPDHTPKIKVIFRGFIITRIRHGAQQAMIGALNPDTTPPIPDAPCHKPIIHVYRIDKVPNAATGKDDEVTIERRDLTFDLNQDFSLLVGGPPFVQKFQTDDDPFNRLDEIDNNKKDFRWFVDLNELHGKNEADPVPINLAKLKPKFFLDRGVFHTSKLSDGEVRILRYPFDKSKRFGRFAMEITARIELEGDQQAVFKNGSTELVRMGGLGDVSRHEIVFDCTCRSADETTSDFENVYKVITVDPTKQIKLEPRVSSSLTQVELTNQGPSVESTDKTPEVYCLGGNG